MGSPFKWGLKTAGLLLLEATVGLATEKNYDFEHGDEVITRDVCIIGGGSSGTFAAVQLRDSGKSVVVIEQEDVLGGHTNTYTDPATQTTIDYGVVVFHNISIVQDYFARFDIPLQSSSLEAALPSTYADFKTGELLAGHVPSDPTAALAAYGAQLFKYPALENGFYLPDPIPNDLLIPFGEFIKKYNLGAAVPFVFLFAQGLGDLLRQPTLYVFKNFGAGVLSGIQTGFLETTHHNNHEIYDKALQFLGSDVLLRSRVVSTDRSRANLTRVVVETPSGCKVIHAKKLLFTIPPKLDNLQGFDLDSTERSLFGQFGNSAYYTGLLRNTGVPGNSSIVNTDPDTPYNLPALPGIYSISPTAVQGLLDVKYGSADALPLSAVKSDIISSVERLSRNGFTSEGDKSEFVAFSSHTPFELTVSAEAIKEGFYKRLYALQGRHNTYYTGAAFHTHDSSLLWQFTQALLPQLE